MSAAPEFVPLIDELKKAYKSKILPLEQAFKFEEFHSPTLTDTDFDAKPMVLLIGQYSTGKASHAARSSDAGTGAAGKQKAQLSL